MSALNQLARASILFLNWRDPSHPQAGGAEVYCHEIAQRFVAAGAGVTLFTAQHPGSASHSIELGLRTIRAGNTFSVYAAAARHMLANRHTYDAVIDFQNGIPFFSPLFTSRWTADVCVIHHVHQHQFDTRFRWPVNTLGRVLEKQTSRRVYRGRPIVVVSPSTREGARRELGFENPIYIVPNGGPGVAEESSAIAPAPVITIVSRLVAHKRIDLFVNALPALLRDMPGLRVHLCGDGEERASLEALADRLGVSRAIVFHGHVSDERRQALLAQAWLTVVPSVAEGWGLTVIEANGAGTPAVAYDVPGLRDAIRHGRNGWLLAPGTDLADGISSALGELRWEASRAEFAERCRAWCASFSWDKSAERLAAVVVEEMIRNRRHRRSRRRPNDLAVSTRFHSVNADALEQVINTSLRQTDSWSRRGDTFSLLLHGCDELRAVSALRRLGVGDTVLTLAGGQDVLAGSEDADR